MWPPDGNCPHCGKSRDDHEVILAPPRKGDSITIPLDGCPGTPILAPPPDMIPRIAGLN